MFPKRASKQRIQRLGHVSSSRALDRSDFLPLRCRVRRNLVLSATKSSRSPPEVYVKRQLQLLLPFILILCAPGTIVAQAGGKKKALAKGPAEQGVPASGVVPKAGPAADSASNVKKPLPKVGAAQKKDAKIEADSKKDTLPSVRANLAPLQCDSNPATEPAQSLCKYLIPLHNRKASEIQPLVADQAEGFTVRAVGDNLLLVAPAKIEKSVDQPAVAEAQPGKKQKGKDAPSAGSRPANSNPAAKEADPRQKAEAKQIADAKEAATLLRLRRLVAALDTAAWTHNNIIRLYNDRDADNTATALARGAQPP